MENTAKSTGRQNRPKERVLILLDRILRQLDRALPISLRRDNKTLPRAKRTQKNYGAVAAAGITNRIVAYSIVTGGLTSGLIYLLIRNRIPEFARYLLILSWVGAVSFLSVLLYLSLSDNGADRLAALILKILKALRIKRFSQGGLPSGTIESLRSFHDGFKFFRENPRYLNINQ